jgi:hypothetical protein
MISADRPAQELGARCGAREEADEHGRRQAFCFIEEA